MCTQMVAQGRPSGADLADDVSGYLALDTQGLALLTEGGENGLGLSLGRR